MDVLSRLAVGRTDRLVHSERIPARAAQFSEWPDWLTSEIREAFVERGIARPWIHQAEAANLAFGGQHVVLSTGTASGKSLAFGMPVLQAIHDGLSAPNGRGATALYLSPTKALANDQLRSLSGLGLTWLRAATYDGDTPIESRNWSRNHANYVLTNPDLIHHSMLGSHQSWAPFLRRLRYIVIDECHAYRGVFGAHVAEVIRRLRRICESYGSSPIVICASATVAQPGDAATRLVGSRVDEVTVDGSPAGERVIALWEPELTAFTGENGAPIRRTATAECADLLADLVVEGAQSLAFVRSRKAAESVAVMTRDLLLDVDPSLTQSVASYRGGYLPEERRELESRLRSGSLRALATTNALELGIDISGLDAVITAGWPGTRASLWQQFGRAGRSGAPALSIFIARDEPLDTYLVHHPSAMLGRPVEANVFNPENPYVLAPHLCAAASELPLTAEDAVRWFGAGSLALLDSLVADGFLRKRPTGWYWTRRDRASDLADLRGTGGPPVRIVEEGTGRILGTMDVAAAHANAHPGAVYIHQGVTHLVTSLNLADSVATVIEQDVDYSTSAREVSDIRILEELERVNLGEATMSFGRVHVSSQVVAFMRRRAITGEVLGEEALDMPVRELETTAVWWTLNDAQIIDSAIDATDVPGAAHAAEHASIGMLPLFATCDRWDIGGVSTAHHIDTGRMTVFVYDGLAGGAGFAEYGYHHAREWLTATRELIAECSCESGCPACIQSPKCGNANNPLDKPGAIAFLDQLLNH
jgi:DEAD/DEAH box helicase domain-containing protein